MPDDILCLGEEILHQLLVSDDLELNVTIAETTSTTIESVVFETGDAVDGFLNIDKFDVCIHCLAGHALHDDVHWLFGVRNESSVASYKGDDLLASN